MAGHWYYVEEYGAGADGRSVRKSSRRSSRRRSPHHSDWQSTSEPAQFNSPYYAQKPDIQSSGSRTSSREWSRTESSLRAPASTMPSSLYTSRSSHRPSCPPHSMRYRRGKGRPAHDEYDDEETNEEDEDETEEDEMLSSHRQARSRRAASNRGLSPRPSMRCSKSAHRVARPQPNPSSNPRSPRGGPSDLELNDEENEDEEDNMGRYDNRSSSSSDEEDGDITDNDNSIHEPTKMPTIPEDGAGDNDRLQDRMRSRSIPRHATPPLAPEGYREEVVIIDEPQIIAGQEPQTPTEQEKHGREPEIPLETPPHAQTEPDVMLEHDVPPEPGKTPRRHPHKSSSRYPNHEGRRRSLGKPHPDVSGDFERQARHAYTREMGDNRSLHRRSHSSRHGHRSRPVSPPPRRQTYSPERSNLGINPRSHRRRSSMDDAKQRRRRQSLDEQVHATPRRRTYSSGTHMTSSYNVSASKRSSSFLGNIFGGFSHQTSPPKKPVKQVECVVCMDDFPSAALSKLKCGHRMCASCLQRSFELSLTDPSHMPPKCCGQEQIPLALVNHLFDRKFKRKWNQKLTEYTMKNPTYCPSKNCNTVLKPSDIIKRKGYANKMGICPRCHTEVCVSCKGRWHGKSKSCPNDPEANKLLDRAKEEGWPMQQCYKCGRLVELAEGCNHMTCRCGSQFCMLCGRKWKKCDCRWFNYDGDDDDDVEDGLDYLNIERPLPNRSPFAPDGGRIAPLVPLGLQWPLPLRGTAAPLLGASPPHAHPLSSHRPRSSHRTPRTTNFEAEVIPTRTRRSFEERRLRRRHIADPYESEYEILDGEEPWDELDVGDSPGHFANEGYRRMPITFQPPSLSRAATVEPRLGPEHPHHKLRKRASSLEQRLASRFGGAHANSSPFRPSGSQTAPVGARSNVGVPAAPMAPASALGATRAPGLTRRPRQQHAVEEDIYATPTRNSRHRSVRGLQDSMKESYLEEPFEGQRRHSEPAKSSVLAGLTGDGRGMNRVFEWRTHVVPDYGEGESVIA